jgi:aspartate aminotransferase-like enzyme
MGIDFVMASANKCLQGVPGSRSCSPGGDTLDAQGKPPRVSVVSLNHYVRAGQHPVHPGGQVLRDAAGCGARGEGVPERIARYAESAKVCAPV